MLMHDGPAAAPCAAMAGMGPVTTDSAIAKAIMRRINKFTTYALTDQISPANGLDGSA